MPRWFYTDTKFREPPANLDCWTCDITNSPPHHWPMHLMTGDYMNGAMMTKLTVFNLFTDAASVATYA